MKKTTTPQSDTCAIPCFDQAKVNKVKKTLSKETKRLPDLADFYKLLGNSTRLKILLGLAQGELCVCDLQQSLGMIQSRLSRHLKILREAGFLRVERRGKWAYYSIRSPLDRFRLQALEEIRTLPLDLPELKKVSQSSEGSCKL